MFIAIITGSGDSIGAESVNFFQKNLIKISTSTMIRANIFLAN